MEMLLLLAGLLWLGLPASSAGEGALRLRILHSNDMHARFEEVSREGGHCSEKESAAGLCYGGFARVASVVREARARASPAEPVLFLNAGDSFQGTRLFGHYHASIVVKFLNILRPDVASLGNHEFDDGVAGLAPFLDNASFPVVAANLDVSREPGLRALRPSTVLRAGGRRVGVVGYLTPETRLTSQTGRVRFRDEVAAVREEAARLRAREGCDLVIALGHSGYELDLRLAREVDELDLVVGGHTNTFLYSGPPPDRESPEGPYPRPVLQPRTGRTVYVVQAYAYTKYLGDLRLELGPRGGIARAEGNPVLLDARVPGAPDVRDELRRWAEPLGERSSRVLGVTRVLLDGDEKLCRMAECNLGNLLTDAMVHHNVKLRGPGDGWTDAAMALDQAGNIRSSINLMNDGKVTMDDVLTSLPFGTRMCKVLVPGRVLWAMLEWSVHDRLSPGRTQHGGAFLQLSGLRVSYNLSRPVGSRVVSAKVRCSLCEVPGYADLHLDSVYPILTNDYLYNGGDGFGMLKGLPYEDSNVTLADVLASYINQTSPVHPEIEGRITFAHDATQRPDRTCSLQTNNSATTHLQPVSLGLLLLKSVAFLRLF